jgi:hypothetical protein
MPLRHAHPIAPRTRLALAVALSGTCWLTACGGGGSEAAPPPTSLGQAEGTADAAGGAQTGNDSASAIDTVFETTQALAVQAAPSSQATQSSSSSQDRSHALAAPPVQVVVPCAGGGNATLTVTGATQFNGQLEAGQDYSIVFSQCTGSLGLAQLNGSIELVVTSASSDASGSTAAGTLTLTSLSVAWPWGSATYDGSANITRSVVDGANGATTATTEVTADTLSLTAQRGSRTSSLTLTNVDLTRTVNAVDGVVSGSSYSGHHTLSGTADGYTFSLAVSTTGGVTYDANGVPVSGAWTTLRPDATLVTQVANGSVTITVDLGNDGTIDRTWTFPIGQLVW